MPNPARIYLTGFMGSGKSTIGPILANVLGYEFVDLDHEIEAREGRIPAIFQQKGEEEFRRIESAILADVSRRPRLVIALGGGALLEPENLAHVRSSGTLVYLKLPPSVLRSRLQKSRRRPLLRADDGTLLPQKALTEKIERMVSERSPIYEQAHITVEIDRAPVGKAVDEIASALKRYARDAF